MTKKPKQPRRLRKQKQTNIVLTWDVFVNPKISETIGVDPFAISPDLIPKGTSYQWCTWTVNGEPDEYQRAHWKLGGWKHVPASRYIGAPEDKNGNIYLRGQMLMERPLETTEAAQAREYVKAYVQWREQEEAVGKGGDREWESPYVPSNRVREATKGPTLCIPGDNRPIEPTTVQATIDVTLTAREVEIASTCNMTNERYAHAKLAQLLQRRFSPAVCAALVPCEDGKSYAFTGISFTVNPQ